jgi:hypothetical protein
MIDLTVLDGIIQLVGNGFIRALSVFKTGSCKINLPVIYGYELFNTTQTPKIRIVITDGEAMVGRVTVKVRTTFFESDKILRSIKLLDRPKASIILNSSIKVSLRKNFNSIF